MDDLVQVTTLGYLRWLHADAFPEDLSDGGANITVDILGFKYPGTLTAEMKGKLAYIRAGRELKLDLESLDWPTVWKQANEPQVNEPDGTQEESIGRPIK